VLPWKRSSSTHPFQGVGFSTSWRTRPLRRKDNSRENTGLTQTASQSLRKTSKFVQAMKTTHALKDKSTFSSTLANPSYSTSLTQETMACTSEISVQNAKQPQISFRIYNTAIFSPKKRLWPSVNFHSPSLPKYSIDCFHVSAT
jgi:hypothetical protein